MGPLSRVLRDIHKLAGGLPVEELSDGQLLDRFVQGREEAAFAGLIERHGPLVLGVCRRVLRHEQDAEDAFQATFLILAKKAGSIRRREALAGWLYEVAYHVALKAKAAAARRRSRDAQGEHMPHPDPMAAAAAEELRAILDEELHRLPDKYRTPLVLCYMQGLTNEEAGRRLGWTKGTVSGRLARARDLLRDRLARRGVALSGGLLAAALGREVAAVPPALAAATARAALLWVAGQAAPAVVSASVAALTEGGLKTMFVTRLKTVLVALFLLTLAGTGAAVWTRDKPAGAPPVAQGKSKPFALVKAAPVVPQKKDDVLPRALEAARVVEDAARRARALEEIGKAQARAGDRKAAAKTFQEALTAARTVAGDDNRAPAQSKPYRLFWVGMAQHEAGDRPAALKTFAEAVRLANALEKVDARLNALLNMWYQQEVEVKDRKGAEKTIALARKAVDAIADAAERESRLGWVASRQAWAGEVKAALKTLAGIQDEGTRRGVYGDIAAAQARAGDIKAALATVKKIRALNDVQNQTTDMARARIAEAQAKKGDIKGALSTAGPITNTWEKLRAFAAIAVAQAANKDGRGSRKTLEQARDAANTTDESMVKEQQLLTVAQTQVRAGDLKGARATAKTIQDAGLRAVALATLAAAQAKAKEARAARETIGQALEALGQVREPKSGFRGEHTMEAQNHWLSRIEIVNARLYLGDFPGALEAAQRLTISRGRAPLLRRIAREQTAAGQEKTALAWARQLKSPYDRSFALLGVAAGRSKSQGGK
jgi:RNA polymerase sigma factor (sigma-70 family)